jgi:protein-tyrosine-phosphatase
MRVLFVCTGNSFRSPVAEALTRRLRPELEAASAGLAPAERIASNAKRLLQEAGALDCVKAEPEGLSQAALERAERIVLMEPGHRAWLEEGFDAAGMRVEVWDLPDPIRPEVDERDAFERIRERVREL